MSNVGFSVYNMTFDLALCTVTILQNYNREPMLKISLVKLELYRKN